MSEPQRCCASTRNREVGSRKVQSDETEFIRDDMRSCEAGDRLSSKLVCSLRKSFRGSRKFLSDGDEIMRDDM
jgi:hypothetical protein